MTDVVDARSIGANEIADALQKPRPTTQQRSVIESPLQPALVVAGAGSGKTETMADRVLWLLANRLVAPGEILGLTFTRKAAGELGERIGRRLRQLEAAGLLSEPDAFDAPVVATYNSFANTIYRDNAVLLGREGDGAVLGAASAWQLARQVVVDSTDERLITLGKSVDVVTRSVLALAHALGENTADPVAVASFARDFGALEDLPNGGTGRYSEVEDLVGTVGALPVLIDLAREFDERKLRRGFVEYSDQVALALRIVDTAPQVASEIRSRHRVVLLDEYQDTSVVQTRLLAALFADGAVMAVGDPHQSIYGWRGASAGNLDAFARQFGAAQTQQFSLSTSWRNGTRILDVANALVEPLIAKSRVPVAVLEPGPHATGHAVQLEVAETLAEEAETVVDWLAARLADARTRADTMPSAAILFRARKTQRVFIEALRRHGVPYHVLGIGGLLGEPEIADLVSALTVVSDPTAGSELVRLLAGSRWRLGVRDLRALKDAARWLHERDHTQHRLTTEVRDALRSTVLDSESGSIIDALDVVAHAKDGHDILAGFSDTGLDRLRDAGALFARLRGRSGLDLLDFVTVVEHELQLDIEVEANEARTGGRAAMDSFFDALTEYVSLSETAGLGGFLGWLREAEWRDSLAPRSEEPEPGTVQLLTIHGSKGLEWDLVAVPRFVEGELPGTSVEGVNGWLGIGRLPYEFRGDCAELPVFGWRAATTRKELIAAKKAFRADVAAHARSEERRLAYVAVTRARHELLLTGSFWATQKKPRVVSTFLLPLIERGLLPRPPANSAFDEDPAAGDGETVLWPFDPLGSRRPAVEEAAVAVWSARPVAAGRWRRDVTLLLAERRRLLSGREQATLPHRVPASRFKDYVASPASVADDLLRPMPERPYRATRLGTLFHAWVETRAGVAGGGETIDALAGELDGADEPGEREDAGPGPLDVEETTRLEALKRTFEASPWGTLKPVEVEREIHLPFDGRLVICKLDAVYERDGRYEVVDWKTGKAPVDDADLDRRQLQLALYRIAYARWRGIDPALIDAAFYFVADDRVIRPVRLVDEEELRELWRAGVGAGDGGFAVA